MACSGGSRSWQFVRHWPCPELPWRRSRLRARRGVSCSPTIYTGFPFTVKVVRDPAYPGVWSQPTVEVTAVFTKNDGSEITQTYSETIQRYGVTYINATVTAPSNYSCDENGACTEVGIKSLANISAIVKEPLNKGKKFRETTCTLLNATVNMSN